MTGFIQYLQKLPSQDKGRQALAALRRGLGKPPGEVLEMHRYVANWLPEPKERWTWDKQVYYLIASLFAFHPQATEYGNLGSHFAQLCKDEREPTPSVERRFNALLASHPDDVHRTLQHAISLLKSKDIAVNWEGLFYDLKDWDEPDSRREVQRRWAMSFWSAFARSNVPSNPTNTDTK